jgi:hypothetical protein
MEFRHAQVAGNTRYHDSGLEQQVPLDQHGRLPVQELMASLVDYELRSDYRPTSRR